MGPKPICFVLPWHLLSRQKLNSPDADGHDGATAGHAVRADGTLNCVSSYPTRSR